MKSTIRIMIGVSALSALALRACSRGPNPQQTAETPVLQGDASVESTVSSQPDQSANVCADSTNKPEIGITAQIRREIVATDSMLINAQNIMIMTNGGNVILRGLFDHAQEKS
jgi:hypothetical protein